MNSVQTPQTSGRLLAICGDSAQFGCKNSRRGKRSISAMSVFYSSCAIYDCVTCVYRASGQCVGCIPGNRQLASEGRERCRVHTCVVDRGITTCLECTESACVLRRSAESLCPMRGEFEKSRWWAGRLARAMESRGRPSGALSDEEKTSDLVVGRLRWYLTALDTLADQGSVSISSWKLAEMVGTRSALIRKDLSRFGAFGRPSYGYRVDSLRETIRGILHLDKPRDLVWVGACAFRHYHAGFARLAKYNCKVVALFDTDPQEVGSCIDGLLVQPMSQMADALSGLSGFTAALAIAGPQGQEAATVLADNGALGVLNMSGEILILPDHVRVTSFDIAGKAGVT